MIKDQNLFVKKTIDEHLRSVGVPSLPSCYECDRQASVLGWRPAGSESIEELGKAWPKGGASVATGGSIEVRIC